MSTNLLSVLRFRVIFSIGWLFLIVNFALLLKMYGLAWGPAIIDSLISNFMLIVTCLLIMNTLRFYSPHREFLPLLVWCIFLTFAWSILSHWLLTLSLGTVTGYVEFLKQSYPIRRGGSFLILACFTLVCVVWFSGEEQKENSKRKQDTEKLAKEAELFKLRQQLQPHFLFNSLNSINALIGTRPEEARKMVQQLSDFLRGTIKKEDQHWVSLKEELQYVQLYLDIEKVRFGNRLSTVVHSDHETANLKLPVLLLQPIVENAIKFGLYDTTGDTLIRIITKKANNDLLLEVQNPFDPEVSTPKQGTGFGLSSVQRRLYLLFGRTDLLSTEIRDNLFITTVKIPQYE